LLPLDFQFVPANFRCCITNSVKLFQVQTPLNTFYTFLYIFCETHQYLNYKTINTYIRNFRNIRMFGRCMLIAECAISETYAQTNNSRTSHHFCLIILRTARLTGKVKKKCVSFLPITFVQNIFRCNKYSASHAQDACKIGRMSQCKVVVKTDQFKCQLKWLKVIRKILQYYIYSKPAHSFSSRFTITDGMPQSRFQCEVGSLKSSSNCPY
jgi:hypothetical protein